MMIIDRGDFLTRPGVAKEIIDKFNFDLESEDLLDEDKVIVLGV